MQLLGNKLHLISRVTEYVDKARKGDSRAQRAIYDALSERMFAVCLRYMGDREAAEDVLQDGFVTLFTKLDNYTGEGSFEGWARKIFVNTALMSLRKKDVLKDSGDVLEAAGFTTDEPSAIQKLGYKELMKIISEMPSGYRTIFNMYAVEGYSHNEIAEELGISESTSRTQLLRARAYLQSKIKGK